MLRVLVALGVFALWSCAEQPKSAPWAKMSFVQPGVTVENNQLRLLQLKHKLGEEKPMAVFQRHLEAIQEQTGWVGIYSAQELPEAAAFLLKHPTDARKILVFGGVLDDSLHLSLFTVE